MLEEELFFFFSLLYYVGNFKDGRDFYLFQWKVVPTNYIRSEVHLIDISTAGQRAIVLTAEVKNCHSFKGPTSLNTSCLIELFWEF